MGWFKKKAEERAEVLDEVSGAALVTSLIRGDSMSKEMALQIPAVTACVNLIADRVASLPVKLYDSSGDSILAPLTGAEYKVTRFGCGFSMVIRGTL